MTIAQQFANGNPGQSGKRRSKRDVLLDVLDRLEGVRGDGDYTALCPAHDDHNPSLSVRAGDHKVLVNCFAGCSEEAVCRAIGLRPRDLNYPKPKKKKTRQSKGRIVAEYDYVDADGTLLYQALRYEPKDFSQRRPDGNGGWAYRLNGVERVLYRLPQLLAAPADQWVFVVEGEKDADRLIALGLVATTNAQGADNWLDDYAEQLSGRRVCVLPDNDGPGRQHAQRVGASLLKAGAHPVVVELPGLPEKGDVSDWLDAGGTVDELMAMADAAAPFAEAEVATQPTYNTWPYAVEGGRLVLQREGEDDEDIYSVPIADFEARGVGEIVAEDGEKTFVIEGRGLRAGPFTLEISAREYGDTAKLVNALEAVSLHDSVHAKMRQHIGPAIKKLTGETWREYRYKRTGWADGKFLMPGRVASSVRIELNDKLPYAFGDAAELERGLAALPHLISAPGAERGALLLAFALQAPLARVAGWSNERYGLFLAGRTGTWKTSTAQVFMALYGPKFVDDDRLITLGNGSTTNAAIGLASMAHDMPILFDNYKPNTGRGQYGLVDLIHRILEGGDKSRMNRNAELREAKPIHTWPIFTGEDLPVGDPASLARILIIPFERSQDRTNDALSKAQAEAAHLSAVGALWLDWLESDEGRRQARMAGEALEKRRDGWAAWLIRHSPNMANPHRVATNLATNELAWEVACNHPQIGPMIASYTAAHGEGLRTVAQDMGGHTEQGLEATRYLLALRELLATDRAILLADDELLAAQWGAKTPLEAEQQRLQERKIGWIDGNGGAYVYPTVARKAVAQLLGDDLSAMSDSTLYDQLAELGAIEKRKGERTFAKRLGGAVRRVLHLLPTALRESGDEA